MVVALKRTTIENMKLMIVDDHPQARTMTHEFLAAPDVTICECASGEEAVQRADQFRPDWVIMDVHLTGMSGFKAAVEIQKVHPAARVIIVTADDQPYLYPLARSIGALGPVRKGGFLMRQMLSRERRSAISSSGPVRPTQPSS